MKQTNGKLKTVTPNTQRGKTLLMVDRYLNGKPQQQFYDNPNMTIQSLRKDN